MAQAFEALRVVELAGSHAGAFAAKMFADNGARVIKVEPPGGDPLRTSGALLHRHALGDDAIGSIWAYCNTSKQVVELDPETAAGRSELDRLLDVADVIIESSAPDRLIPTTAGRSDERAVKVYISPYGLEGPTAHWRSNVFTDDAMGGHMYLNGEPDREPFRRQGRHTEYSGGMYGFVGAMSGLLAREAIGLGQTVEIAHIECMVAMHQHTTSMWTHAGHVLMREGNAQPGMWHPAGVYECQDGHVFLCHAGGAKLIPFLQAAGLGDLLEDPRFANDVARGSHKKEFNEAIRPWLMSHTVDEICELGVATFSPMGPVWDTHQFLADPHLAARDYLRPLDADSGGEVIPRGPFRITGAEATPRPTRGLNDAGFAAFVAEPPHGPGAQKEELPDGPLTGIRVLDLTRVWAGPLAGRLLGDLGADVIHIESPWNRGAFEAPPGIVELTHLFPDNELGERHWNRVGGFNKLARNKRDVVIDIADPRGNDLFRRLLAESDVILENYSPRVMPQWGFDFDSLLEINPSIIHTAMPGYGAKGPGANRVALGPVIEAATGMTMMSGYADTGPYRSGVAWPDPVSGMSAAAGTLVALWRRATSHGRGQQVETAMLESMGSFAGDELLSAQVLGGPPPRRGNREPGVAPQGVYRCSGHDRWIAISVTADAEWEALCEVAGLPDQWRGLKLDQREAQQDAIDAALTRWSRSELPWGAVRQLQAAGVIAGVLCDARDLLESEHLGARDYWALLDQQDTGALRYPGCPVRLSRTPATYRLAPPMFGEHNDVVLKEIAGVSEDELAALRADRIVCDEPPRMR